MFPSKMFEINLLLNLIDTREMNLIFMIESVRIKGLAKLLRCYKQEIQGQPLVLTFMGC